MEGDVNNLTNLRIDEQNIRKKQGFVLVWTFNINFIN